MNIQNGANTLPDEEICRHIYENIRDAILLTVSGGQIVAANPAACRMFGKSEQALCDAGWKGITDAFDLKKQEGIECEPDAWYENLTRFVREDGVTFTGDLRTIEFALCDGSRIAAVFIRDVTRQIEAGRLLRNAEQRYRSTLDSMIEGCQIIGHDWRYVYLNATAIRQSHKTAQALLGRTMMEAYPGIEDTGMFSALRACMEQKSGRHLENTFVYPGGEKGIFELSVQSVPEGLFILSVDITERKQAEERLRRSEENLRMFIEYAPAAIAIFDRDMKYLAVSRRFYTDYGIEDQNIIGRSHYEVFPEITEPIREIHRRCLSGNSETGEAAPFARASGKIDWVSWEIHPWYTIKGEIGGITLFSEVVTAQKQAELALLASEQRWKFALEGSGDGIWDWDVRENKVYYSSRWKSMLGYGEDEIGDAIEDIVGLIHPDDRANAEEEMERLQNGEASHFNIEHRLRRRDGGYQWVLSRGMAVAHDDKGHPLRIIGTQTDIRHMKSVQESLIKSNRAHRLLSTCNEYLVRSTTEDALLHDICRAIVEQGSYLFAWVCLYHTGHKAMLPAVQWGDGKDYLDKLSCSDRDITNCPARQTMISRKPNVIQDIKASPQALPHSDEAVSRGFASFIALPLMNDEEAFGSLNIFSSEPYTFSDEEVTILSELASDLAYGLTALRLQERHGDTVKALESSEEKYRTLFESASEAILMADVKTRKVEFANPAACAMLDYSAEELTAMPISAFHPEDCLNFALTEFEAQFYGRKHLSSDIPFRRKGGGVVYADINATRMMIGGQELFVGFITDVTQRRLAAEEREASEGKLLKAMTKTVELISRTVELRDPYTAGHQERVTVLAEAIAKCMGLPENETEGIRMAAIVHDVGKMCIPSEILSKPGRLNALEYDLVKTHAQAGYDILKDVEFPWPIADIVLQHHERMDGSGYPNGLSGPEISPGARIIAVADVVEAMASHRPYRPSLGIERALKEISDNRGRLYDEQVAAACFKLFEEGFIFDQP